MGKSHQAGWVVLRGKRWYGYFRKRIVNPITNEEETKFVCIPLGLKTNMTKSEARDALRTEVTKSTGQNLAGGRVLKDSSTTFGWFVRNRYFPLREGDWRPESAKVKKIQIERDLLAKFEEYPLDSIDRFMLQTHVNDEGYPGAPKAREGRYHGERVHAGVAGESVKQMVGWVYTMLKKGGEVQQVSGDLLPKTTNASEELAVSC
jgi:hypothetical protein